MTETANPATPAAATPAAKTLLVWVHPVPDSYSSALRDATLAGLEQIGQHPEVIDLYRSGFDASYDIGGPPSSTAQNPNQDTLARHKTSLAQAEELLFVYPTWWDGLPAILKSWLEQMFPQALDNPAGQTAAQQTLGSIKRLTAVTTHGSSRWVNFVQGRAGRKILGQSLKGLCADGCRFRWVSLYKIDRLSDKQRRAFLQSTTRKLARGRPLARG